jgi:putative DNA primase/helicase
LRYITSGSGKKIIDLKFYKSIGLFLTKNGDLKYINENLFARYICTEFDLVLRSEAHFFQYKDNYWQKLTLLQLQKLLRDHINSLVDNCWTATLERDYISALYRECKSSDELISGDDYICVRNGLIYLSGDTFEFIPHSKDIFCTAQIPVTYYPNNAPPCKEFHKAVRDIFSNDAELINVFQEVLAYCCLSNHTKCHKLFVFWGGGRNGKSLLLNIARELASPDATTNLSLASFRNSFEVASIVDKRLSVASESEITGSMLETSRLKLLASGDDILINPKNEKPFSYKPMIKLIFAVNSLPKTLDTSVGFLERLVILPFRRKYSYEPKTGEGLLDPNLYDKLILELDGIFAWTLEGLVRLTRNGFKFSKSKQVDRVLQQYQAIINPYVNFICTKLQVDSEAKEAKTEVYKRFKLWAGSQGYTAFSNISARQFYMDFEANLQTQNIAFSKVKVTGVRSYKGFSL